MTKEEHQKLLSDFSKRLDDLYEINASVYQYEVMEQFIKSLDSVNPVEPEPFTGIKGDGNKCEKGGKFPCLPNLKYNLLHCTDCDKTE